MESFTTIDIGKAVWTPHHQKTSFIMMADSYSFINLYYKLPRNFPGKTLEIVESKSSPYLTKFDSATSELA